MEPPGSEDEEGAVGGSTLTAANNDTTVRMEHDENDHTGKKTPAPAYNAKKQLKSIRYNCGDSAPYRVYVELSNNAEKDTKLNKFSLGASLQKMDGFRGHIMDMRYLGRSKIMVIVNNFIKANALVDAINAPEGEYRAYVPRHLVTITGKIAGVPADITEAIILPFTRKVELCEKCLRYGHRTLNCRGIRRCGRCGDRHEEENQYNNCDLRPLGVFPVPKILILD